MKNVFVALIFYFQEPAAWLIYGCIKFLNF